jgi:uncharacterized protein (DUF58 family)
LRLGQRRIFIIPTRGGLLFALALVVMLLGAINYTLALGHALVFLLAGLGIIGMVHTFRNLYGLIITPGRSEPIFAGEMAHFQLTLGNDRPSARLALELEAEKGQTVIAAVNPQESAKISLPVSARKRGWLALPRVRLATRYPLGLFVAWSYLQPAMRCLVYPQPINSPLPAPSSDHDQRRTQRRWRSGGLCRLSRTAAGRLTAPRGLESQRSRCWRAALAGQAICRRCPA